MLHQMAKSIRPLTHTEILNAKPREKEYNLSDGLGLYLRIKTNGTKLWLFNYARPVTKKRANLSFGVHPDVTLALARQMRQEARTLLAQGIDPQQYKKDQARLVLEARENTLEAVAARWLKVKRSKVKEDTANDIWRSLELHVFPELGDKPVFELKAPMVIKVLDPLAAKGTLETVRRLTQRINEVMRFATNTGVIEHNPLAGISDAFEVPKKQHLPTIEPKALPKLMQDIQNASIRRMTRLLIEWQLNTMTRPSEAAAARWEEIDVDKALWKIPKERMKADRDHIIPLSQAMLDLLAELKPISGHREHIFPSQTEPRKHMHASSANMAIKRMGYHGELVAHGLRSLASTTLNEQGFHPDVIEAALSHKDSNEVRDAYNRAKYIERRRSLMESWSQQILAAKQGREFSVDPELLHFVNKTS